APRPTARPGARGWRWGLSRRARRSSWSSGWPG
ncbi:MAG: hypothetical protein AVDCRST_MAG88-628, partial [uncultured Thermomicrobiales bacterium]